MSCVHIMAAAWMRGDTEDCAAAKVPAANRPATGHGTYCMARIRPAWSIGTLPGSRAVMQIKPTMIMGNMERK